MNLPNRLTIARIIMIPFFMVFMIFPVLPAQWNQIIAAVIFAAASFTDFLDGYIARKYNIITDFGKFLDPIADKLMIFGAFLSALIMHSDDKIFISIFVWAAFIVIFRETAVTSLRMITANKKDVVIAANRMGKVKTASQIICVFALILEPLISPRCGEIMWISYAATAFMTIMTVASGISYFKAYMPLLDTGK